MLSPELSARGSSEFEPVSLGVQLSTLIAVLLPFAGVIAGVVALWGHGFSWVDLGVLVAMYLVTGFGITVGFHRLFSHRCFETTAAIRFALVAAGSMAIQGSLIRWVAQHRRHHQFSDSAGDPHSPHHHGSGIRGVLAGFWHAHIGWAFKPDALGLDRYVVDLNGQRSLRIASLLFPLWIVLGLAVPFAIGGLITGTWSGAFFAFIWGGLVRVFLVHHVTWSVNSVCHLWGSRPYPEKDRSRNNFLFGILALGEGWHNNHHAFPNSARHGLRWWQIDPSYWCIRTLAFFGLAWNVRLPAGRVRASA